MFNLELRDSLELRKMIAKRGKNVRQFSDDIGVSAPYMSLVINGKRNPSPKTAQKIAKGLEVDVKDIFMFKTVLQTN